MNLTDRISLLELCDREFPGGFAAEIGVAGGHFSKQVLATWKSLSKMYLIDAWKHFPDGYSDSCNLSAEVQEDRFQRVVLDLASNPKVEIIRAESPGIADKFANGTLDFIYLDANHSTKAVRADLDAWWSKLKPSGILAGHDYCDGNGEGYGVKPAVNAFASEWDLRVFQTTEEYCRPSGIYGPGWEGCSFALRKPS
jgi:hypothetical protein